MGQGDDTELFLVRKLWRKCDGFRELRSKGSNEEEAVMRVCVRGCKMSFATLQIFTYPMIQTSLAARIL